MLEIRVLLLCLPSILFATTLEPDNKSILTDSDWKKLWMEAGNINPNSKTDNSIDASDSPAFDDTEMMAHNTTVQLGGTAFLVCKVAGVDRVGVNWVCLVFFAFCSVVLSLAIMCINTIFKCEKQTNVDKNAH